jgi:hypothetical protein
MGPEDIAIKISITIEGSGVEWTWEQGLMSPNEFQTFFIRRNALQT